MSNDASPTPDGSAVPAAARESVRRDMQRTSTAVGFVLFIVLVLALVGGLTGARATRNLERAEKAEAAGLDRLWNSYVAQARATRVTATAGRRETALQVVSNAAATRAEARRKRPAISDGTSPFVRFAVMNMMRVH